MERLGARARLPPRDREPAARRRRRLRRDRLRPGRGPRAAGRAVADAWFEPDPVALAVPLADLLGLFAALHAAGRRIAVATTDDRRPTEATLSALGLADLVETVLCGDDPGPIKPDPAALHAVADRLGTPIAAVAMVGDTPADLRMAREAGAGRVIGVASGVTPPADLRPLADVVLADVGKLVEAPTG